MDNTEQIMDKIGLERFVYRTLDAIELVRLIEDRLLSHLEPAYILQAGDLDNLALLLSHLRDAKAVIDQ